MKKLLALGLFIGLISQSAFAEEVIAPSLQELTVNNVAFNGKILKSDQFGPRQDLLIGIPVTIFTGDVCTDFVGQLTKQKPVGPASLIKKIKVLGASDPMADACIEIAPMPIDAMLTVRMSRRADIDNLPIGGMLQTLIKLNVSGSEQIYTVSVDPVRQLVQIRKFGSPSILR